MAILGAHMSIAGGYYRAVEAGHSAKCDCVQIFTKNNNQWRAKEIKPEEAAKFRQTLRELSIHHPLSHSSYLINLATPDKDLWKKSVDAFVIELQRADLLGVPYVVLHPGAYTSGSEQQGLTAIVRALDEIHRQTQGLTSQCLLETTAGQGSTIGWRFEQLAEIIARAHDPERLGICFDTCHVFAAGYPLTAEKDYRATMRQFHKTVGVPLIKAFHLNDSKRELGSRVDRHEHIGRGCLGKRAFANLLTDRRFRQTPMYLETAKGEEKGQNLDVVNLTLLRKLAKADATKK